MITIPYTNELEQFRQQFYQNFNNRADTLMELVAAVQNFGNCLVTDTSLLGDIF
jgi:hypothetical protein